MISIVTTVAALNTPMRVVQRSGAIHMGVADMEGTGPETGGKVFDPMGLSKIASEETLAWYRAAELKHSRVAMAAATGWAYVASGGPLFPGYLSIEKGVTFMHAEVYDPQVKTGGRKVCMQFRVIITLHNPASFLVECIAPSSTGR